MNLKSMIYIACCMAVMSCGPQKKKAMEETEVLIETSMGDMKVKLYNDTPKHRDNFIKLARAGAYDNILFHRVVRGFMVQTGDPALKPGGMKPAWILRPTVIRFRRKSVIRAISIRKAHWRQPVWGMT